MIGNKKLLVRKTMKTSDKEENKALASRMKEMAAVIGTQAQAAEVAQISPRQFSMYLSGETAPPFPVVSRLAEASRFNPLYVMTGKGTKAMVLPTLNDAMNPLPGNLAATLEVRRNQLTFLNSLYSSSPWPIIEGREDELVIDTLQGVMYLPPECWDDGNALVEASHAAALRHILYAKKGR